MPELAWAGHHAYRFARWHEPAGPVDLQRIVAGSEALRVVATRHCFNDIADSDGDLVSVRRLPVECDVDADHRVARVSAWATYGEVAVRLHRAGWAVANLASLPHISVGGAVATGTHGSGDRNGSLATAVVAIEYVAPDGGLRMVDRTDPDFAGHVVALGALGVWTHVHLRLEPAFDVAQTVRLDVPWSSVLADLDAVTSAAYSVSLFTDFSSEVVRQVWLKARTDQPEPTLDLGRPARTTGHMLAGGDPAAVTAQLGVPGPWHERLPHFRADATPSRGSELQSELLVPRGAAVEAVERLRALGPLVAPLLQVAELRTVAADDLWLSGAYAVDVVGFHFTWELDEAAVLPAVRRIEAALLPLGARPHWGKLFAADAPTLAAAYPRLAAFRALRLALDPDAVFVNDYVRRVLGSSASPAPLERLLNIG